MISLELGTVGNFLHLYKRYISESGITKLQQLEKGIDISRRHEYTCMNWASAYSYNNHLTIFRTCRKKVHINEFVKDYERML